MTFSRVCIYMCINIQCFGFEGVGWNYHVQKLKLSLDKLKESGLKPNIKNVLF